MQAYLFKLLESCKKEENREDELLKMHAELSNALVRKMGIISKRVDEQIKAIDHAINKALSKKEDFA